MSDPFVLQFKLSDICPAEDDILSFLAEVAMDNGLGRVGRSLSPVSRPKKRRNIRREEPIAAAVSAAPNSVAKPVRHMVAASVSSALSHSLAAAPSAAHETGGSSVCPRDIGGFDTIGGCVPQMQQVVVPMEDSTELLRTNNSEALYRRFDRDGYILLRGVLQSATIKNAEAYVQRELIQFKAVSGDGVAVAKKGWTVETSSGSFILGDKAFSDEESLARDKMATIWGGIAEESSLKNLQLAHNLHRAIRVLAAGQSSVENAEYTPRSFASDYGWLRVKAPGEFTPEHSDAFYFLDFTRMFKTYEEPEPCAKEIFDGMFCTYCLCADRSSQMLLCDECNTCAHICCLSPPLDCIPTSNWYCEACKERPTLLSSWVPIGDVPMDDGVLCVLKGSHKLPGFDKPDKHRTQLPASYKVGGKRQSWATTSFKTGDMVIFNSSVIHCTSKNYSNHFRLSMDNRWVLAPQKRPNFGFTAPSKFILNKSIEISDAGYIKKNY